MRLRNHLPENIFEVMAKDVNNNVYVKLNTTALLLDAFIVASQQNMQHISSAIARMSDAQMAVNWKIPFLLNHLDDEDADDDDDCESDEWRAMKNYPSVTVMQR